MTNPITVNSTRTVTSIIRNGTAIEKMMLAWEWQPQGLFLGDVQAAWYDPIDTANDDWRRNLLTYSEQFDNAAWGQRQRVSIAANVAAAPDGSMTADKLISTTVSGEKIFGLTTSTGLVGQTMSVYAKAAEISSFIIFNYLNSGSRSVTFDLLAGSVTSNIGGVVGSIEPLPNGWYRCIARYDGFWTEGTNIRLPTGTGNDVDGILIWGAQLDRGPTATPYQRITDVNTEVRALFPNTTMFQNSVEAPNAAASSSQTTGLWLDKSKLLALGPDLVNNGTFTTATTGWAGFAATLAINNSRLQVTPTDSSSRSGYQNVATVVGKHYKVTAQYDQGTTTGVLFRIRNLAPNDFIVFTSSTFTGVGTAEFSFVAGATSTVIELATATGNTGNSAYFDSVSIREITGNHALQTSLSLRPLFGRSPVSRRNLLIRSQEFENSAWTKLGCTLTANAAVAPDGTTTADKLIATATTGVHRLFSTNTSVSAPWTVSVYAKAGEYNRLIAYVSSGYYSSFNLTLGTVENTTLPTGITSQSITPVGNGWYRCVIGSTSTATGTNVVFGVFNAAYTSGGNNPDPGFTGDGTSGIFIWGAQLEVGSTATPYQKVVTALDITEAGVPSYAFMRPDLSDDRLTTNMASTKNLIKYSEEFDNAVWLTASSFSGSGGAVTKGSLSTDRPDGTTGAVSTLAFPAVASSNYLVAYQSISSLIGVPITYSVWLRVSSGTGTIYLSVEDVGQGPTVTNSFGSPALTLTTTWQRFTLTGTRTTGVGNALVAIGFDTRVSAGQTSAVPLTVQAWGAQLELGSTATTYEYSGFRGDIIVAGKNGTAYETNVASTTGVMDLGPLTYTGGAPNILRAVGDVVGYTMARKKFSDVEKAQLVRYYKKRGAKGLLIAGPTELVVNGDFSSGLTGWSAFNSNTTISNVLGTIRQQVAAGSGANSRTDARFTTVIGRAYRFSYDVVEVGSGAGGVKAYIGTNAGGSTNGVEGVARTTTGNVVTHFVASAATYFITTEHLGAVGTFTRFDNISVRELRPEEEW